MREALLGSAISAGLLTASLSKLHLASQTVLLRQYFVNSTKDLNIIDVRNHSSARSTRRRERLGLMPGLTPQLRNSFMPNHGEIAKDSLRNGLNIPPKMAEVLVKSPYSLGWIQRMEEDPEFCKKRITKLIDIGLTKPEIA